MDEARFLGRITVEAFAASWIEIAFPCFQGLAGHVEAFAASWIEIYYVLMVI